MPIVYLLRHAQSVANTKGILAGQDDTVALSKLGQKQAQTLVPYLKNIKFEKVENEDVWCPTTENNTWVMYQNGLITITGNSAYANAWAAKWYKKKGGGWR